MKRTHKDYKTRETIYNPITQKFNDPNIERHVSQVEQQNFIDVIAKNKVSYYSMIITVIKSIFLGSSSEV